MQANSNYSGSHLPLDSPQLEDNSRIEKDGEQYIDIQYQWNRNGENIDGPAKEPFNSVKCDQTSRVPNERSISYIIPCSLRGQKWRSKANTFTISYGLDGKSFKTVFEKDAYVGEYNNSLYLTRTQRWIDDSLKKLSIWSREKMFFVLFTILIVYTLLNMSPEDAYSKHNATCLAHTNFIKFIIGVVCLYVVGSCSRWAFHQFMLLSCYFSLDNQADVLEAWCHNAETVYRPLMTKSHFSRVGAWLELKATDRRMDIDSAMSSMSLFVCLTFLTECLCCFYSIEVVVALLVGVCLVGLVLYLIMNHQQQLAKSRFDIMSVYLLATFTAKLCQILRL